MIIRRSKINAILETIELKKVSDNHPEMKINLSWQMEHLKKLMDVRQKYLINDDYTSEDHANTSKYVELLTSENYEELSKLNFIIDENN